MNKKFFWLHIKKSAGQSVRKSLSPYYVQVNRNKRPKTFIQADQTEYNDILNNFRVVLGDYQFKRALFAKTFLYPNDWNDLHSFAFSREPIDRCKSMFFYLLPEINDMTTQKKFLSSKKQLHYKFDQFLNFVEESHITGDSSFRPISLHFSTHTAPVFPDVTDHNGKLILTKIYRLENMEKALNEVAEICQFKNREVVKTTVIHRNENRPPIDIKGHQKQKIIKLYEKDFELYETAKWVE